MSSAHHHHNHQHPHGHGHGHDYASANQAFFDKHAHTTEHRPMAAELAASIRNAVLGAYAFDKDTTTVMDFACLWGVDISQGMVDEFNKRVAEEGIDGEKMRAQRVSELKAEGTGSELGDAKFDVIFSSVAFHHIQDLVSTTRTLATFLNPGGVLLVVDFPVMDFSKFPADMQNDVVAMAGLQGFEWTLFKGAKTEMHPEEMFIAKGVKV
ncbi:Methyltransf-25 domain-containing protein [Mycena kentingensis (nom. inval.)]|nr:Methyltransf-25 domain-containing protein [Mycena kentingensis (nom. inval.)]